MKQNGFTLIELMIVVAIFGIVAAIALPVITGHKTTDSFTTQCRGGFLFDVPSGRQVIGANGGGVECGKDTPSGATSVPMR